MTRARDVANIDTILTTKGDIYAASAAYTPARLAAGADGSTLLADSVTTTGLRWQPQFLAGKNKIINGDFGIWQRGTSFSFNNSIGYTADRWVCNASNAVSVSQQAFTAGTAPVAGYESTYFTRVNRTSRPTIYDDYFIHRVEDVRIFAGQTVTYSFWAKSTTAGTVLSGAYVEQWFGSGGSSSVYVDTTGPITLGTTWQRYTKTITMPSIAGKTIGTGSFIALTFGMANSAGTTAVYDIWGVQWEAGSVATPFTTATGTLAGELAACQRYYWRNSVGTNTYDSLASSGIATSTTQAFFTLQNPVPMRVTPTSMDYSTTYADYAVSDAVAMNAGTAIAFDAGSSSTYFSTFTVNSSSLTQWRPYFLRANAVVTNPVYVGFSAEL